VVAWICHGSRSPLGWEGGKERVIKKVFALERGISNPKSRNGTDPTGFNNVAFDKGGKASDKAS